MESAKTRIGIIGAGAIGCVVGGLLAKAGHDVTLVDQWPEHVEQIKSAGLRLSGSCGEHLVPVTALHLSELAQVREPFEAVFVAVKSYDTEWATQLAVDHLRRPDGVVVDFQNGINDHRVAAVAGRDRTLGCVILISAGMYEPAHAIRTDRGSAAFKIGEHDGSESPRAWRMAEIMSAVAPAVVTTNLWGERWSKLALNCMLNPLAGLSGLGTAEVRSESVTRRLAAHLGAEVVRVGTALGHRIEPILGIAAKRFADAADPAAIEALGQEIAADAKSRTGGRPSMLQDVMKGRRTEIDYLNGFVAAEGRAVGVVTPFNDAVVDAFHAQPVGMLRPEPRNLDPLVRLLA
jgi:2-dehydropantoate 2-reductase